MTAEEFNKKYKIGESFIYMSVSGTRGGVITKTRSEAWTLGHGEVVVKVEGVTGGVSINHLTPC